MPGGLLALLRQVNRGQDNGARVRMAGAQVVEKLLPEIVGRIEIEDEEVRPLIENELLRFFQAVREIDVRVWRRFAQRLENGVGQMFIRCEDKNAAVRFGGSRFVHVSTRAATQSPPEPARRTR